MVQKKKACVPRSLRPKTEWFRGRHYQMAYNVFRDTWDTSTLYTWHRAKRFFISKEEFDAGRWRVVTVRGEQHELPQNASRADYAELWEALSRAATK